MSKITELELLQDTIDFYGKDPLNRRSTEKGSNSCLYNGPNGTHCGVGRWMMPRYKKMGSEFELNHGTSVDTVFGELGSKFLQRKVQHISKDFWQEIQSLHDEAETWNYSDKGKLSEDGVTYVKFICTYCGLDFSKLIL